MSFKCWLSGARYVKESKVASWIRKVEWSCKLASIVSKTIIGNKRGYVDACHATTLFCRLNLHSERVVPTYSSVHALHVCANSRRSLSRSKWWLPGRNVSTDATFASFVLIVTSLAMSTQQKATDFTQDCSTLCCCKLLFSHFCTHKKNFVVFF